MLKVAFRFYDMHLFEHSIAQGLEAATGPASVSFGYSIGDSTQNKEAKKKVRSILDEYKSKEYRQTPLLDNFKKLVDIIADANYGGDRFRVCLLMIYDACIRKELHANEV